jgi:hypothetical protein
MIEISTVIDPILTFVAGLLIGIAAKKGVTAAILGVVGILIAGYVGLSFVSTAMISTGMNQLFTFIFTYVRTVQFGAITMSLSVVLFLVGLVLGVWKG